MTNSQQLRSRARATRGALPVAIAGVVGAVVISFSFSPSLAAFTASINNTANVAGAGTLVMQESLEAGAAGPEGDTVICTSTNQAGSSATCSSINKFGSNNVTDKNMVPGQTVTTTINIKNTGTADAATFTLDPGDCTVSNNDQTAQHGSAGQLLCDKYNLTVTAGSGTQVFSGTLATFAATATPIALTALADGASESYTFALKLDSSADATYSGLQVSQPLTWTFSAGS